MSNVIFIIIMSQNGAYISFFWKVDVSILDRPRAWFMWGLMQYLRLCLYLTSSNSLENVVMKYTKNAED